MIAAWMLYATMVTACFLVAAVGLEKSLRLAGLPARWIVGAATALSVVLPLVPRSGAGGAGTLVGGGRLVSARGSLAPLTEILPHSGALPALDLPLIVFWIGMSASLLAVLAFTHVRIARRIRSYPAERINETIVLRSPALGPAVVGMLKSAIVLPAWVDEVEKDWRGMMVLHEREHLRGRDGLLLSAAVLVTVALPWNIPMWFLLVRMRRAIELDCDQRVLRSGVDVRQYGSLLLEVSRRRVRSPLPVVGLAFNRSFLAQRIETMTLHMSRFRYPRAMVAVLLGGAFAVLACELPAPSGPDLDAQPMVQEVIEESPELATWPGVSYEVDSAGVTFAIRPQPGDLTRIRSAIDLYAIANESTLVRVPEELAQRIRGGGLLMIATEENGEPVVLLRKLGETVGVSVYPKAVHEHVGR